MAVQPLQCFFASCQKPLFGFIIVLGAMYVSIITLSNVFYYCFFFHLNAIQYKFCCISPFSQIIFIFEI